MPYTVDSVRPKPSADELRARIPGWGADLPTEDRPAEPQERIDLETGAHWDIPEQQPETRPRERSIEHLRLTPVFGTAQPLRGVSGAIRRYAYDRYGEARFAHWLLLLGADRVDAAGSRARAILAGAPDDPIAETGVRAEGPRHGFASRFGRGRADLSHQWVEPLLVAAPYVLAGMAVVAGVRRLRRG